MSTQINARTVLDFALLQSAAECYLDGLHSSSEIDVIQRKLKEGANNALLQGKLENDPLLASATRFTDKQAEWFTKNYVIVTHYPNDSSGFSATLFRNEDTGEYTLSFRSTEYQFQKKGGDYERDGSEATDGDISEHGYALAQLASMETFYANLKAGKIFNANSGPNGQWESNPAVAAFANGTPVLNVTGYSLGAHLSSSFTLMHSDDVAATWNFNASGIGGLSTVSEANILPTGDGIKALIDFYDILMHYDGTVPDTPLWSELVTSSSLRDVFIDTAAAVRGQTYENVYDNPLHDVVMQILEPKMYAVGAGSGLAEKDSMGDFRLLDALTQFSKALANADSNVLNTFTSSLFEVNGQTADPAWQKIKQFYGHGEFLDMEFVANSGWHVTPEQIFIEDLPLSRGLGLIELAAPELRDLVGEFGETHSITPLIDSLTVLDMLQGIDASMDMAAFTALEKAIANSEHEYDNSSLLGLALDAALATAGLTGILLSTLKSNKIYDADALENTVNAMHKIFLGTDPGLKPNTDLALIAEGYGNLAERNALHNAIADINAAVKTMQDGGAGLGLQVLVGASTDDLQVKARQNDAEGLAYRYALAELNPFAVVGADYTDHNLQGALDLDTEGGQITESWLADRAGFLFLKMQFDTGTRDWDDLSIRGNKPYSEDWDQIIAGNTDYIDLDTVIDGKPLKLAIDGAGTSLYDHQIVFGSERAETLEGSGDSDRLYGGGGNDRLLGGEGADYLEGGAGNDIYVVQNDGQADTIHDSDGLGSIWVGITAVNGVFYRADAGQRFYYSADGKHRLVQTPDGSWELAVMSADNTFRAVAQLSGWESGELGISLETQPEGSRLELGGFNTYTHINASNAPGATKLIGSIRSDSFNGSVYSDWIITGDGLSNYVSSYAGDDRIEGGAGGDFIIAGKNIYSNASSDRDVVTGGGSSDVILGGGDDDTLWGMNSSDSYQDETAASSERGDWISGQTGSDYIFGSSGKDVLFGGSEGDLIRGGAGDDLILGDANYAPTSSVTGTNDAIISYEWSTSKNTWVSADKTMNPVLIVNSKVFQWSWSVSASHDYVLTAKAMLISDVRVDVNAGDDYLDGGKGNDWIAGQAGSDYLNGGEGNDILYGDDALALAWGQEGNDVLVAGQGADTLYGGGGNDTLLADEDDQAQDILYGGDGNNLLFGGTGHDQLHGGDAADELHAGSDGSFLYGHGGSDWLYGGAGDDEIRGGSHADYYFSSGGKDLMSDDSGEDAYSIFSSDFLAPGSLTRIVDGDGLGSVWIDGVQLEGSALTATSATTWSAKSGAYTLTLSGPYLWIALNGQAVGQVVIEGFSPGGNTLGITLPAWGATPPGEGSNTAPTVTNGITDQPAAEGAVFSFTVPADTFADADAGDSLTLSASLAGGGDLPAWLAFDAATRTFTGTPGAGDVGSLSLKVTATDKAGASVSSTFAVAVAEVNDAPVVAHPLGDQAGAEGAVFSFTVPADTFADADAGDSLTLSASLAGGGDLPAWLTFDAATRTFTGTPGAGDVGSLSLKVTATDKAGASVSNSFDLTLTAAPAMNVITGTSGNDVLYGYATADVITGGLGNDWIYGKAGDDLLRGEGGRDYLYGGAGHDTLEGGADDDVLNGEEDNDVLLGGAGNDTLYGGAGNDVLQGGTDNDSLYGNGGNDTYRFNRGDGQDWISEYDSVAGNRDVLELGSGITDNDIRISRNGDALILGIAGSTDKVTVANYFNGDGLGSYALEEIRFADGTVWNLDRVKVLAIQPTEGDDSLYGYATADVIAGGLGNDWIYGKAGDDLLRGEEGRDYLYGGAGHDTLEGGADDDVLNGEEDNDVLLGGAGNDTLYGGAGNDVLHGGAGNDSLYGNGGNDTYRFNRGDGQDWISEYDTTAANVDILIFGAAISTEQLWFSKVGSSLEISIIGTGDKMTVSNWYSNTAYRVEQFKTHDGQVLTDGDVQTLVDAMAAFAAPVTGQTVLPDAYQQVLTPVIAGCWDLL